jgi:hypothetical protein
MIERFSRDKKKPQSSVSLQLETSLRQKRKLMKRSIARKRLEVKKKFEKTHSLTCQDGMLYKYLPNWSTGVSRFDQGVFRRKDVSVSRRVRRLCASSRCRPKDPVH